MNERVLHLRQESLNTKPWISIERAALLTEFYKNSTEASIAIQRAKALQYLMEHKTIRIGDGELIVGERGPSPKGTPTFPELCCHSMEDFKVLDQRDKISYSVDKEARKTQHEGVIPYWHGRSMRDLIFREMTHEWKDAYEAGVF